MDISANTNCPEPSACANEGALSQLPSQATDRYIVPLSVAWEGEEHRQKYLAQLEAQHQAHIRQMEYEKQIRQQQVRQELEQRRKWYEQQGFC